VKNHQKKPFWNIALFTRFNLIMFNKYICFYNLGVNFLQVQKETKFAFLGHQAKCKIWGELLSVPFHKAGAFKRNRVAIFSFIFLSHFFINLKKLSAYLTQHFLNFIKLPNLFNFDTILRDLWPVECKRSSFETHLKM